MVLEFLLLDRLLSTDNFYRACGVRNRGASIASGHQRINVLEIETRYALRLAIFDQGEVILGKPTHQVALLVADNDVREHKIARHLNAVIAWIARLWLLILRLKGHNSDCGVQRKRKEP